MPENLSENPPVRSSFVALVNIYVESHQSFVFLGEIGSRGICGWKLALLINWEMKFEVFIINTYEIKFKQKETDHFPHFS